MNGMLAQVSGAAGGLRALDWWIIVGFMVISLGIGLWLSRRAQSSTEAYFKGGGRMGWLLLGTSMVATAFAADTPLALAGWVVTKGLSQNWFWWSMVPVTMLGVFFFAPLWKRANPMTDMELVYQRYSGRSADALRVGKALWLALPFGCMNMGWVNKAMTVIISYVIPEFPRVPVLDALVLSVFIGTPLSSGVDDSVREAVRAGDLRPMEVAYETGILRQPAFWSAYEAGAYEAWTDADGVVHDARWDEAWSELGLGGGGYLPDAPSSVPGLAGAGVPDGEGGGTLRALHGVYQVCAGVNQYKVLLILFLIVVSYTAVSGLLGVMMTDFIQFWVAMGGCVLLAWLAVREVGGLGAMFGRMNEIYGEGRTAGMMDLIPGGGAGAEGLFTRPEFLLLILVFWWSYAFTDGGSFFAQRMLSARDERNAALGYLWYGVAHYALRMWPWLLVGFAAAVMFPYRPLPNGAFPGGSVAEAGYVRVMLAVLPSGLLGLMIAALFAAYMSTISTWVNLGASYLMNDVYRPFVAPRLEASVRRRTGDAGFRFSERHHVRLGIVATLVVAAAGILTSLFMNTISGAWFFLAGFNGGIGVIYLLRWYWWRINAWSELVCLVSLLVLSLLMHFFKGAWVGGSEVVWFAGTWLEVRAAQLFDFPFNLLLTVPASVGLALAATFLTSPTDEARLREFHRRVQAGGPGWRRIDGLVRAEDPGFRACSPLNRRNLWLWIGSSAAVYFWLLGFGKLVIGEHANAGRGLTGENAVWIAVLAALAFSVLGRSRVVPEAVRRRIPWVAGGIAVAVWFLLPVGSPLNTVLFGQRVIGVGLLLAGTWIGWGVASALGERRWNVGAG